jgi:DNA replication protein DnaC
MKTIKTVLQKNKWQTASAPAPRREVFCNAGCPECGGIGYVRYDVPVGHPRFGKLSPCPNLPAESSIYDGHGLSAYEIRTLDWDALDRRENIQAGIDALETVLQRGRGLVYIHGGPGLAKTVLLKILCAKWARAGRGVFHLVTQKGMIDYLRVAYDDDEPQRAIQSREEMYIRHSLLAIDEVTAERNTDFKVDEFFHIINKRHEAGVEHAEQFATVMVGNIPPTQLDYRIRDRLSDGRNKIVMLMGESYRPAMEWQEDDDTPWTQDPRTGEWIR